MQYVKTKGILLKKTVIATDDAFLEFLTEDYGKICVSVRKFAKSQKRVLEIDFFRLLELEILEGRNSKSLHSARTILFFPHLDQNFEITQYGFQWISLLEKNMPLEKPIPYFFHQFLLFFQCVEGEYPEVWDLFFRIKMLDFLGIFNLSYGVKFFDSIVKEISWIRETNAQDFLREKKKWNINFFRSLKGMVENMEKQ